ncbi:polysaccharide biosynthesis C-terminal domain-containing protein [Prevotella sp. LCP21S3_D2]|uniref:polysaccharide biosynthesis C-terminal domain-containing protein n=1 Tax=Prevotella sp. LCP21S3_D2 TaxID=3438800 RepID=UPI003F99A50C
MRILVTGAKGFVGKNLCSQLNNIKEGKARCYGDLQIDAVYEYDIDSTPEQLDEWCKECDFVFNLAGVNRPKDPEEFMKGNFGFASTLLNNLKKYNNNCPVMISSSIQATLAGRFGTSEYGKSKKAGEELMFEYGKETGAKVLVYRFPNLFGKWCRPNYNSAIATFCNNIANDLPIQVNDRSVEMELLYIDDLVDEMIRALKGEAHYCTYDGLDPVPANNSCDSCNSCSENHLYCYCPITHKTSLGEIVDIIHECADAAANKDGINMIALPQGSLRYKLMTTYLSYLPKEKAIYDHKMNVDARGSFTELLHTLNCGQVSINISKPGITKGEHWHHSKFEYFTVVSGHGLIQLRPENPLNPSDPCSEIIEYEVSGDKIQSVIMLPGYTHNIINLSENEDLVTVMYCNEIFNPQRPDTYFDKVVKE